MELLVPDIFGHFSPRAASAMSEGKKVFTLALPRSENRPHITARSEATAQFAAAKLCDTKDLQIEHVWHEDGMHDDWGMYRRWYVVAAPATRATKRKRLQGAPAHGGH